MIAACWTVFARDVECGAADGAHPIPAGQPVRVIGSAILRCAEHASIPVDEAEVDAARHRLDVLRETLAREASSPQQPRLRVNTRPTRPKSFASLGDIGKQFDPKVAAAGDRATE